MEETCDRSSLLLSHLCYNYVSSEMPAISGPIKIFGVFVGGAARHTLVQAFSDGFSYAIVQIPDTRR